VLDRELDENRFIRPGLGDAGDRLFGTIKREEE
jgi:uracil phosphoribosyltransferase